MIQKRKEERNFIHIVKKFGYKNSKVLKTEANQLKTTKKKTNTKVGWDPYFFNFILVPSLGS